MSPTTSISWLHLSDLHFQTTLQWSHDVVLTSLLADINTRYTDSPPDLLFITGDVAYSGRVEEYALAEQFISELLAALSISPERLFIVPGNHDVNLDLEEDAFRGAKAALHNEIEVDKFLSNEGRRRTLFKRQEAFRAFANRLAPPDNGGYTSTSFAHTKHVAVGPISVDVLLLDSAWLAEGGVADVGNLLVGERQVIDAGAALGHSLRFGLVHHPFAWLREFEQTPIENLALRSVQIVLRGHVHATDLRAVEALERRLTFLTAGAAFETRTSDNSYSWGSVDLATGKGTTVIHKYVHAEKSWPTIEPKEWSIAKVMPAVDLKRAIELCTSDDCDYIYYTAALIAGHVEEVPRMTKDGPVFLNFNVDLDDENELGRAIISIRNISYWEPVLDQEWLATETAMTVAQIQERLNALADQDDAIGRFLDAREEQCRKNAEKLLGFASTKALPVFDLLEDLSNRQDWDEILKVVERWSGENLTTDSQKRVFRRFESHALLGLARFDEAKAKIDSLLDSEESDCDDYLLCASYHYRAKNYDEAGECMHKAIDAGIPIEQARKLALLIAGQTGDQRLTERVTK